MKKVRGVWLTNVDSDVYHSKNNIDAAIELLSKTGFNVVFPVVWNKGYTLYPSDVMEQHFGSAFKIDPLYQVPARDPLEEIVKAARKFKLKVIPWFEYGFAASAVQKIRTDGGELQEQEFGKHILDEKPNFAAVNHSGQPLIKPHPQNVGDVGFKWMNALNPEVQDFMIELMVEVLQKYDVDGIQGDDRLPAFPVEGYDQDTAKHFNQKHGKPPNTIPAGTDPKWMEFRADVLTKFLQNLCEQVRQVETNKGKKLLISMAPHPRDFGFGNYLQDTKAWLELVDMMHPQLYRKTFSEYKDLVAREVNSLSTTQIAKLSPGVLIKLGDYRIGEDPQQPANNDPNHLQKAIKLNRDKGFAGETFFFFEGLRITDTSIAEALRGTHYAINKLGDEGPDVFKIQVLLKKLNVVKYDPGEVDGIFGKKTEDAVKAFQKAQGFSPSLVDGKVGIQTLGKLGVANLTAFGNLPVPL
ncbi:family 10 glycosylhydrolase [Oculatella sp. FACHB-28]|uniref:family 10 glycosylhydrolase n=1 Tax=Oculatella sp. FACHB-28 TaxID=2692845 RepID=UPI001681F5AA|nr:family 10 glycosylhydrolase [Oculatella sp. FACHB-28]MBD2056976.1 family 10 glycosylhydrolase [Oculatella sp. FACHB-28]